MVCQYLDNETKCHMLNYYYQKMLYDTEDDDYVYKFEACMVY